MEPLIQKKKMGGSYNLGGRENPYDKMNFNAGERIASEIRAPQGDCFQRRGGRLCLRNFGRWISKGNQSPLASDLQVSIVLGLFRRRLKAQGILRKKTHEIQRNDPTKESSTGGQLLEDRCVEVGENNTKREGDATKQLRIGGNSISTKGLFARLGGFHRWVVVHI